MGYGGGGSGGGGSGGSGGSGGGGGGSYTTVGGGSAFGDSSAQELPSYNQAPAGSIRFNTDSKKLEVYILGPVSDGVTPNGIWMEVDSWSPDLMTGGTRGLFAGGFVSPASKDIIDYINIATTGNAIDFGNLTVARRESSGFSNRTRALWAGNAVPGSNNTIDFVTISSTGNATDYGDLLAATNNCQNFGTCANATRGIWAGGYQVAPTARVNIIQYNTIDTNGNTIDFGDLLAATNHIVGAGSATRGLFMGGDAPSAQNVIQFVTISTLGNSADFGDLLVDPEGGGGGSSNAVRALYFAKNTAPINYITIATLGDAQDFGDLTSATNHYSGGSPSSSTRACYGGGGFPSTTDVIDYVQIMTKGNSVDFGNLTVARSLIMRGNCSNGHGGL
jgi:hypothetical protein